MSQVDERQLGHRVQRARQAAGMTQQTLCQKAHLSYSTLAKIERGAIKTPSIFTIRSIAAAVGVSLDELVGVGSPTPAAKHVSRSGVRFVYFDVNDTLVERFFPRAIAQLAVASGVPAHTIEELFWRYRETLDRGEMTFQEFNSTLAHELHISSISWEQLYLDTSQPMPGMQEVVRWVSRHYRIGLLSNSMPGLIPLLIERSILPNVAYDVIIDSSAVHLTKPEQAIFTLAQQRAEAAPGEILFIDDTQANILAAQRLGWHVMQFDNNQPLEAAARIPEALALADPR